MKQANPKTSMTNKQTDSKWEEQAHNIAKKVWEIDMHTNTLELNLIESEIEAKILNLLATTTKQAVEENNKKWREKIEDNKKDEMSASEGVGFKLNDNENINDNMWSRLQGSHKPAWIASEIYNQALSDLLTKEEE